VRPADQFAAGHVPGAVNIPQADLAARAGELPEDRDAPIVMVCAIGRTSKETILYLKSLGYRRARNLKGGITEWLRKGQTIETGAPE
jgi:rhodanese-related sulfurtransferase